MPGILRMEPQGVASLHDPKKDRSNAQEGAQPGHPPAIGAGVGSANAPGQDGANTNGAAAQREGVPTTNGDHVDVTMTASGSSPPPLDMSWRQTPANKSLGTMMERVAQQCYSDLNDTINKMSELGSDEGTAPRANGVPAQPQQDMSETSRKKKRLLLEFAQDQRDRFTKTLVLSDWARNEDEMAKLIDIKVWQDKQRWSYTEAATAIGDTKRKMIGFKVPAPNLEGAMGLLATGKAPWIPDLGYIPPKRLTAKQLLKTLRGMNVTLATRLNLHDELPPHMQHFSIANGRATFSVPDEFEVDLSVASEEPTSPFYFIDIRFLFSPSPGSLHDHLRGHLEGRVNEALATGSLQGCYDFLHNFVLTHKINTLRNQAQELIRNGKWFDCIKVEHMRRSLVVQYWTSAPGPKNWFEIGISSGKQKAGSRQKPTPKIVVRWFRKGRLVQEEDLDFDWKHLDLERCLLQAVAKHCIGKLTAVKDGIRTLAVEFKALRADLTSVETAPEDCTLSLSSASMRSPMVVRIEPVTGQMSISPRSAATLNAERIINTTPNVDAPRLLATIICQVVQEQLRKQADLLAWRENTNLVSIRAKFGADVWQRSVFQPPGWGQHWALAVSLGLHGEKWWTVQLVDSQANEQTGVALKDISLLTQLVTPEDLLSRGSHRRSGYTRATLLRIEKLAVAEVSYGLLSQQLRHLHIPHRVEKVTELTHDADGGDHGPNPTTSAVILVRFSPLMRDGQNKSWKPWAIDFVRLSHHGLDDAGSDVAEEVGAVHLDIRLSLEAGKMKHLQSLLSRSRGQDIVTSETGGLAIRLRSPFGKPFTHEIQKRMRHVERLDGYVAVLRKLGFTCTFVGLARLAFSYCKAPELSAQILFASDGEMRLKLEPRDSNPHHRVRVMLEQQLNGKDVNAFPDFAHALSLSLPVLQTFERLETADPTQRTLVVRSRTASWYSFAYRAPLPVCAFELRAKTRTQGGRAVVKWHLHESKTKVGSADVPEDLAAALNRFWTERDERWIGFGNGMVTDGASVGTAVQKLDELVQRCEGSSLSSAPTVIASSEAPAMARRPSHQPAKPAAPAKPPGNDPQDVIMLD